MEILGITFCIFVGFILGIMFGLEWGEYKNKKRNIL